MKKISEKLFSGQLQDVSRIWGGTQTDPNCYTMSSNQGLTDAGYCDTVFKVDGTQSSGSGAGQG